MSPVAGEREAIIEKLMPPRRPLTKGEEFAFETGRLAIFRARKEYEARMGVELPPFDEDRILFRAGLEAAEAEVERLRVALNAINVAARAWGKGTPLDEALRWHEIERVASAALSPREDA